MDLKKVVPIILSLCLFLGVLTACSGNSSQSTKVDGNLAKDLNGDEFWFQGSFIPKNPRDFTDEEKEENLTANKEYSPEEEAMMEHVTNVENKYNCIIHCVPVIVGSDSAFLAEEYSSGEMKFDFMYDSDDLAFEFYKSGFLADIKTVKAIDLTDTEKWGSEENINQCTYKGGQYCIPCIGSRYYPYAVRFFGIMMERKSVYDSFNLDTTPREMNEKKQWTFDNFKELLKKTSRLTSGNEVNGLGVRQANFPLSAVYANGGDLVNVDSEGKYTYGLSSTNSINAISWAQSVFNDAEIKSQEGISIDDVAAGKSTFLLTTGYRAFDQLAKSVDDMIWLPFPYGPDAEYGSTCSSYQESAADCAMFIFKQDTDERLQNVGIVFDEVFGPTEKYGKDGYQDFMYRNYFIEDDKESFDLYTYMSNHIHNGYSKEINSAIKSKVDSLLGEALKPESNVASLMPSLEAKVNANLSAFQEDAAS